MGDRDNLAGVHTALHHKTYTEDTMRRIFALLATLAATLCLPACGGGDPEPEERACVVNGREMPAAACR